MLRKQVSRSGVILSAVSDTRKRESFDFIDISSGYADMDRYDIFVDGQRIHHAISEEEMEDVTQDLADDFYQTGTPHPESVDVIYIGSDEE
jgi:nucleoside-triphosphatase THEP1